MNKIIYALFVILGFALSCKSQSNKSKDLNHFIRENNETAIDFINRIEDEEKELNVDLIETNDWVVNANTLLVFFNNELEDDLGIDVEGVLYISSDEKKYHRVSIDR